jgi:hypothetical protein
MITDTKVVLPSDPEAATYRTDIRGWVSRTGLFYGEGTGAEASARYDGSTHNVCDKCSAPAERPYTLCAACIGLKADAKWAAMPRAPWDGKSMLYSTTADRYFADLGEAEDWLEDQDDESRTLEDLRIVICKPRYVTPLHYGAWDEWATEDGQVPAEIQAAVDVFNAATVGVVLGWWPGDTAVQL